MDDEGYITILGRITGLERFKVLGDIVYAKVIEDQMSRMSGIESMVAIGVATGSLVGEEIIYCIM